MKKIFVFFLIFMLCCMPTLQISNADILDDLRGKTVDDTISESDPLPPAEDVFEGNPEDVGEPDTGAGIIATILKIIAQIPDFIVQAIMNLITFLLPSITYIIYGVSDYFQITYFQGNEGNIAGGLYDFVSQTYSALRYMAMVIYVIMIAYLAIRMLIASVGKQKAMYKTLIKYWFTGILLLGAGHYIMAYVIWLANLVTNLFYNMALTTASGLGSIGGDGIKMVIPYYLGLTLESGVDAAFEAGAAGGVTGGISDAAGLLFLVTSNPLMGKITAAIYLLSAAIKLLIGLVYIGIVLAVIWTYVKRLFTVTFLMMVYPLVTVSYVFDKIGDRKAQTLQRWFQEFATNVFLQPIHAISLTLIIFAMRAANPNIIPVVGPILALIMLMFLFKCEDLLRKIFQLNTNIGGASFMQSGAGLLGTMHAIGGGVKSVHGIREGIKTRSALKEFERSKGLDAIKGKGSANAKLERARAGGYLDDYKVLRDEAREGRAKLSGAATGLGSGLIALGAGGNLKSFAGGYAIGDATGQIVSKDISEMSSKKNIDKAYNEINKNLRKDNMGDLKDLPELERNPGESDADFDIRKEERNNINEERKKMRKTIGKRLGINQEAVSALITTDSEGNLQFDKLEQSLNEQRNIEKAEIRYGAKSSMVKALRSSTMLITNTREDYSKDEPSNIEYAQDDKNLYVKNNRTGKMAVIAGKGDAVRYAGGKFSGWTQMPEDKIAQDGQMTTSAQQYADEQMSTRYSHLQEGTSEYNKTRNNLITRAYDRQDTMFTAMAEAMKLPGVYEHKTSPDQVTIDLPPLKREARENYENVISTYMTSSRTDADFSNLTQVLASQGISADNIRTSITNAGSENASDILNYALNNRNGTDAQMLAFAADNTSKATVMNLDKYIDYSASNNAVMTDINGTRVNTDVHDFNAIQAWIGNDVRVIPDETTGTVTFKSNEAGNSRTITIACKNGVPPAMNSNVKIDTNGITAVADSTLENIMPSLTDEDKQAISGLGTSKLRFDTTMNSGGEIETVVTSLEDSQKTVVVKPNKERYSQSFVMPSSENEVVSTAAFINEHGDVVVSKGSFAKTDVTSIIETYSANPSPYAVGAVYDVSDLDENVLPRAVDSKVTVVRQGTYQTVLNESGTVIYANEVEENVGNAAQETVLEFDGSNYKVASTGSLSAKTMKKVQNQVTRERMGRPTSATEAYANEMIENWEATQRRYERDKNK